MLDLREQAIQFVQDLFEDYISVGSCVYVESVCVPLTLAISCHKKWIRMRVLDPRTVGTVNDIFLLMVKVEDFASAALIAC